MATQLNDNFESEKQLRQLFALVFVIVFLIVFVIVFVLVFMFVHVNRTNSMIPQIRIMDGSGSNINNGKKLSWNSLLIYLLPYKCTRFGTKFISH